MTILQFLGYFASGVAVGLIGLMAFVITIIIGGHFRGHTTKETFERIRSAFKE